MRKPLLENHYCRGCHRTTKHIMDSEKNSAVCQKCNRAMIWNPPKEKR